MKKLFKSLMAIAIAAFTFIACEDVPEPYNNPYDRISGGNGSKEEIPDPAGSGTAEDPYNVAKALLVCAEVGEAGTPGDVYAKGYIVEISDMSDKSKDPYYGNATYYISDTKGGANRLEIYHGYGLNGDKFVTGNEIKEGDFVVVKGKLVNFRGSTPEFTTGSSIVSINNEGGEPTETVGTKDAPKTVAEALTAINALEDGATSKEFWYIKAKVVKVTTNQANFEKYGNLNYLISDDGTESNTITVYSGDGLNGAKFTGIDAIKAGDEVIVYGQIYKYVKDGKVTPEINKGSYLVSLVSGDDPQPSGEAKGTGTLEDPFNAVAATNEAKKLANQAVSEQAYYIKGKVASIAVDKNGNVQNFDYATYGNASFYISDDGTETNKFYCYRVLYLGNKKWEQGAGEIVKVGDEVIVCAHLTMYNSTPETAQGQGFLYSLNGVTEGGETPPNPPAGDLGTLDAPITVAAALDVISGYADAGQSDVDAFVKGKIVSVVSYNSQYKSLTYYISDDGTSTNQLQVYSGKGLNGADFTSEADLTVGATVIVKGKLKKYVKDGNVTPEIYQNNQIVYIDGGGTPSEPSDPTTPGDITGNTITVAMSSFGLANAADLTTLPLADGTTLSFSIGSNDRNSPKYYTAGNGSARMYPGNTMTINAGQKTITAIKIVCNEYSGTLYNASGNITSGDITPTIDGVNLVYNNIRTSSITLTNSNSGSGAATQLRMETLIITYAE